MRKQQTRSQLKSQLFHKDSALISPSVMSPQIFKWKVAALIISVLIAILFVINVILIIQISNIPDINNNYSYLSDIATQTQIIQTKSELLFLIYGLSEVFFQSADLVVRLEDGLSQSIIRQEIFFEQNQKMLFLFQLVDQNQQTHKFGIYMNGAYPLPEGSDFNRNITYYSFQIDEQRKSAIFSLQTQNYLKMSNPRSLSPLRCQTYQFKTGNPQGVSFGYLQSLISFQLTGNNSATVDFTTNQKYRCFEPQFTIQGFQARVRQILDWNITDPTQILTIQSLQVYHLKE